MGMFRSAVAHATVLSPRVARHDGAASAGSPPAWTRVTVAPGSRLGSRCPPGPASGRASPSRSITRCLLSATDAAAG